jgi:hypothetical protein
MRRLQDAQGLDQLIEVGSKGFFPLFYQDWILESYSNGAEAKSLSFSRAAETVHRIYKQIEKHQSIERKKTAIHAMNINERKDFVLSFIKMVEYRTLDNLSELH